jgi:hypothetical protein
MASPAGLEPATLCLEGRCSIQLSYGLDAHILAALPQSDPDNSVREFPDSFAASLTASCNALIALVFQHQLQGGVGRDSKPLGRLLNSIQ